MERYVFNLELLKSHGKEVFISGNSEIKRPELIEIGNHVAIDWGFYCTTAMKLGSYIHISPYCTIIGGLSGIVEMQDFSGLSVGCRIICASDEYLGEGLTNPMIPDEYRDKIICKPVRIERFATLGTNVVVMPGITIKEGSVVGANSLVKQDTEEWTVYVGNPAKPLKSRPREKILEYAKKIKDV